MRYLSVAEIAKKWDVSERSVRNYCAQGRVNGARKEKFTKAYKVRKTKKCEVMQQ